LGDYAQFILIGRRAMSGWSREYAIALERRHISEGEQRVARQEALATRLIAEGHEKLVDLANEI
jgi:hypothetical protein